MYNSGKKIWRIWWDSNLDKYILCVKLILHSPGGGSWTKCSPSVCACMHAFFRPQWFLRDAYADFLQTWYNDIRHTKAACFFFVCNIAMFLICSSFHCIPWALQTWLIGSLYVVWWPSIKGLDKDLWTMLDPPLMASNQVIANNNKYGYTFVVVKYALNF